jgi:ABC-2 type transport system permease protein
MASSLRLLEQGQPSWKLMAIPVYDADLLRATLLDASQLGAPAANAGPALAILAAWIALLTAGAVFLFRRQDLTKE